MPRKRQPPRLYLRERAGREGVWVILDAGREISTGCGAGDREAADEALGHYLIDKRRAPGAPKPASELTVADILATYAQEHGESVKAPATLGYNIQALLPFWGKLTVDKIRGETCRRYARERGVSSGTVRRELGTLRSAIRHCHREGYLTETPAVWLPEQSAPRQRWLTRSEAARLLQAARRWPHLQRFILIGLYTASRSGVIRNLQWLPNNEGGHVDLERGVMYRKPVMAQQTRKRATPVRIPRKLLNHMRRWSEDWGRWVVEFNGKPMLKTPQNSWRQAREAAGLDAAVIPHVLRHSAITWMCQSGAPIHEICSFAAVTAAEMERTYIHHHPRHQSGALKAFGG